jgi:hypothetical protein
MPETIHSQADAMNRLKKQKDELFKKMLIEEQEVADVLEWAEFRVTKKVRKAFQDFEKKVLQEFKKNKWTEAEGRGIAYLLHFTGILEGIIEDSRKKWNSIQTRKQKEG